MQDGRDDAGRAVGRGGDDPAAGRVLLVDRHRVERDPLHRVRQRVALGAQLRGPTAAARRRTFRPPGRMPSRDMPRGTHACITRQISSSPARISSSVRQARSFSSISAEIDRPVSWVSRSSSSPVRKGCCSTVSSELDAVRADRVLVDDEAAADRVVRLRQQLGARRRRRRTASCRWRGTAGPCGGAGPGRSSKSNGISCAPSRPQPPGLRDPLDPVVGALHVHRARRVRPPGRAGPPSGCRGRGRSRRGSRTAPRAPTAVWASRPSLLQPAGEHARPRASGRPCGSWTGRCRSRTGRRPRWPRVTPRRVVRSWTGVPVRTRCTRSGARGGSPAVAGHNVRLVGLQARGKRVLVGQGLDPGLQRPHGRPP